MKKPYTYDIKGEIIPVKGVNVDTLAKECNFEMRYNTRKMPLTQKGIYSFEKAGSKIGDKRNSKNEDRQDTEGKGKKKGKAKDDYLETGKDLKRAFATTKLVKDPIQPMGSNFDRIEPDQGVTIEEKGRTKKGSQSQSVLGMTRTDYMSKFNKTSLNYSTNSNAIAIT